jgi:hypothetical protein
MEYNFDTAYKIIATHTENIYVWIPMKSDGSLIRSMKVSFADAHTFLREVCQGNNSVPIYRSGEDVFLGYTPVVNQQR